MITQNATRPLGAAGPDKSSLLGGLDNREIARNSAPTQAEFRNPLAVRDAKLELLRESIFENLGATRLFIDTAQLFIDARDDAGMRHSIGMAGLHFKAAVTSANELSSVNEAG